MRNFAGLVQQNQSFRHGISMIPTSSIAGQYYCEQKVEMEYVHGDVETEAKLEGGALHEKLIQMRKTSLDDIIRGIKRRKLLVASFPIFARFSKLVISGVPDAIVFLKGSPAYIIELKTTKGDTSRLWKDQLVQVRVYGMVLEEMGFNCSRLKLVVVRVQRANGISEEWRKNFMHAVLLELFNGQHKNTKQSSTTHVVDYSRDDAVADVKWAEAYWLSRREPIPTTKAMKCRACEFGQVCPRSLANAFEN